MNKYYWLALLCFMLAGCLELLYPADDHLQLPDGNEMRLHCVDKCPDKRLVLAQMESLSKTCLKDYPKATYEQWAEYALTWSKNPWYNGDTDPPIQIMGATYHNKNAIYVFYPGDRVNRVVKWELLMASLELIMPYAGERKKIDWQLENCPNF